MAEALARAPHALVVVAEGYEAERRASEHMEVYRLAPATSCALGGFRIDKAPPCSHMLRRIKRSVEAPAMPFVNRLFRAAGAAWAPTLVACSSSSTGSGAGPPPSSPVDSGSTYGTDAGTRVQPGNDASAVLMDARAPSNDGAPSDVCAGTFLARTYMGRNYKLYVPASYGAGVAMPLVMMLHGCEQTPDDFATGTAMNPYADAQGFLVAYPEQPTSANTLQCWNWAVPADQARGSGEPALLAGMVADVESAYSVDATRVYAAGISAGAAMSVILGATYPDVFAAIAVHSGLEYAAAGNATDGLTAASSGGPDPKQQGDLAFTAMGTVARVVPVMVIHGSADQVVNVVNGHQVIAQWVETDDRAAAAGGGVGSLPSKTEQGSAGGKTFTHSAYADSKTGATVLELYVVDNLGHAWAGGNAAGSFTDPNAPNATAIIGAFFGAHAR